MVNGHVCPGMKTGEHRQRRVTCVSAEAGAAGQIATIREGKSVTANTPNRR